MISIGQTYTSELITTGIGISKVDNIWLIHVFCSNIFGCFSSMVDKGLQKQSE